MAIEGTDRVKGVPAFLRRHPALWVEWLRLDNSLSRLRGDGRRAVFLTLCAIAVIGAFLVALSGHVVSGIEALAEYWVLLAAVAAIYAATSVSGRWRRLEESRSQSWLVATPIPPRSLHISQAIRVLLPLVVLGVAVVMFPALIALSNEGVAAAAEKVAGAAAGGLLFGSLVGWFTARRAKPSGVVPSRYVPQPRLRRPAPAQSRGAHTSAEGAHTADAGENVTAAHTAGARAHAADVGANVASDGAYMRPDAAGLSSWPIAQVLSWSRPENSRYVLVAALLAVQGGSSALTGLSVIAMYFVASYLAALLPAMMAVASSAAIWLRATPITLMGFVWSVSRKALAHQLIGVALAIAGMMLLGSPLNMALQVAALWLGLFISISGFALVDNYRGRSPLVKIALSIAVFAAITTILQLRAGAKT